MKIRCVERNGLIPDSFQVCEQRALPRGACSACLRDALAAFRFRALCRASAAHWDRAPTRLMQIHDPSDEVKSFYVFYTDFYKSLTVMEHHAVKTETPNVDVERPRRTKRGLTCSCPDCDKTFSGPIFLNRHLKNTLKRVCTKCGKVLPKAKLAQHMYNYHNVKVFDCSFCHKLFNDFAKLYQHTKKSHSNKSTQCDVCKNGFDSARSLNAHMYSHSLFHCTNCSRSFDNLKCYRYHQTQCRVNKSKLETNKYTCDYCGSSYDKKPSLRIHINQKHLNVLPYVCETCGKRTSTIAHLKSHEAVHTQKRKIFECYCGAKMRTEVGFQMHTRIHTGEKPYECEECGDKFLSASRKLDHIKRRHRSSQDMPYGCDKCAARFVRPFELKKHYLSVHYTQVDVTPVPRAVRRRKHAILKADLEEEPLCPLGACVPCVSSALAAQEFRLLVRAAAAAWQRALAAVAALPAAAPPVRSLCAFLKPDSFSLTTYKNYKAGDTKTVLNKIKNKITKKKRVVRTGPPCDCPDCGKNFLSPHYLSAHLSNSGQKEVCAVCGLVILRGKHMKKHMADAHKQNVVLCKSCPLIFKSEIHLKKHVKKAHKVGALTCSDCGRSFPRKGSFEAHSQMHAVRTCRACGVQFTNRACYREHRAKCEPNAKPDVRSLPRSKRCNIRDPAYYTCDYCNKTYTSRPQLKNHIIWIHMDVRPYQCTYCEKKFYTAARLAEHTVVHTRERNFECDICGAKLVSKMAAVYHRRRHTGEKPYECKDCGERFLSASRRSEHAKRRHGKGVRHQCGHCSANFVRTCELRRHCEKYHAQATLPVEG